MKGFIGVTDNDWFAILSHKSEIGDINFYVMWRLGYITTSRKPAISKYYLKKWKTGDKRVQTKVKGNF
jgi:hypothetical protein